MSPNNHSRIFPKKPAYQTVFIGFFPLFRIVRTKIAMK